MTTAQMVAANLERRPTQSGRVLPILQRSHFARLVTLRRSLNGRPSLFASQAPEPRGAEYGKLA